MRGEKITSFGVSVRSNFATLSASFSTSDSGRVDSLAQYPEDFDVSISSLIENGVHSDMTRANKLISFRDTGAQIWKRREAVHGVLDQLLIKVCPIPAPGLHPVKPDIF